MLKYISTKGQISPVSFDEAILQGFASDGGLFVPEKIPVISLEKLKSMSDYSYQELAFEILSLYIDSQIIPKEDLKRLITKSFSSFAHPELMPIVPLNENRTLLSMELFHGPTLSFKDIAMGLLINMMDYFLERQDRHLSIVLATTGDTGPAAAFAAKGLDRIDCFPLYPVGMISKEQERQMTTLNTHNVQSIAVNNCPDGGDDLDLVVARLFSSQKVKEQLQLSSVNSINWCRVLVQSVHYAYGYLKTCDTIGDPINFCVPSGAFGNLFAGYLARQMGIPINQLICANNENKTLHTAFSSGIFRKKDLIQTVSSAIDIVVPYNFWRFLYFSCGSDSEKLSKWMMQFEKEGKIVLDEETHERIKKGFSSCSISDDVTLKTINRYWKEKSYLLDPHGAVAVAAAEKMQDKTRVDNPIKTICLTTAHPAKFPEIIGDALSTKDSLPDQAFHPSLERASKLDENNLFCDLSNLEKMLKKNIQKRISKRG
jgi:threonine synthase